MATADDLNARLLAAHEAGDSLALIGLYTEASDSAATSQAKAFFLTHAYVYALERGDRRAIDLKAALADLGAEAQ